MRKIINKSPSRLIDMEFNIPIFNADTQMYVCMDVSEIASSPGGKDYNIMLSEVKGLNYSVPERIDINLFIPTTDANGEPAHVIMNEVRPKGDIVLTKVMVTKSKLSSLAGLKEVFYNMAKSM